VLGAVEAGPWAGWAVSADEWGTLLHALAELSPTRRTAARRVLTALIGASEEIGSWTGPPDCHWLAALTHTTTDSSRAASLLATAMAGALSVESDPDVVLAYWGACASAGLRARALTGVRVVLTLVADTTGHVDEPARGPRVGAGGRPRPRWYFAARCWHATFLSIRTWLWLCAQW
jgi:hypothetical protein